MNGPLAVVSAEKLCEQVLHTLRVRVHRPRREELEVGVQLLCPRLCHSSGVDLITAVADDKDFGGQVAGPDVRE